MNVKFKIATSLLQAIRADLNRPHQFAAERVGFILARSARSASGILIIAHSYCPLEDDDYVLDSSVGAMMGPEPIRKAMELALTRGVAIFHVHSHGGAGLPTFSGIDLRETAKFVPDFLKVAPHTMHGAIVLSDEAARGLSWRALKPRPRPLSEFVEVGNSVRKWVS